MTDDGMPIIEPPAAIETIEVLGHKVKVDLQPGDIILDIVVLGRIRTADAGTSSGILVGVSEDADETVVTGLLHRAVNMDAAAEARGTDDDD